MGHLTSLKVVLAFLMLIIGTDYTNIGTTKGDGSYSVSVANGKVTLVFSDAGYTSSETIVNNQTKINVASASASI